MKIVSLYPFLETIVTEMEKLGTYHYVATLDNNLDVLKDCEVLIGHAGNAKPEYVREAKSLKLLQLTTAGNDVYKESDVVSGCVVCNASGTYGLTISEHLLLYTLAMMRNTKSYMEDQIKHEWNPIQTTGLIYDSTFLIVGTGDIGMHYAKAIKALGGHTIGVRRRSSDLVEGFDEMHVIGDLNHVLPRADVVVFSLPKSEATNHIMQAEQFALMKKGGLFMNVGRSNAVDMNALMDSLNTEHLGGAQVDVYDEEPVPANSSLWDTKHLIMTPHISGTFANPVTNKLFEALALDNVRRYVKGQELANIVDFHSGYRK